jgi:hypothetical protein
MGEIVRARRNRRARRRFGEFLHANLRHGSCKMQPPIGRFATPP